LCDASKMDEPEKNSPKQNYKWPWFLLAGIILGIALAILWMTIAVKKIERERNFNAPLPNNSVR
jgi:hypothetical protein